LGYDSANGRCGPGKSQIAITALGLQEPMAVEVCIFSLNTRIRLED
jgi:hypothetical protein